MTDEGVSFRMQPGGQDSPAVDSHDVRGQQCRHRPDQSGSERERPDREKQAHRGLEKKLTARRRPSS